MEIAKDGTYISDGEDTAILLQGSNRDTSNASMIAIGYLYKNTYFFVSETYEDIYRKPELTSRRISTCESLWNHSEKEKVLLNREIEQKKPTKKEIEYFNRLSSILERLELAFSLENLNSIRLVKNKAIKNDAGWDR